MSEILFRCKFQVPKHSSKKNEKRIGFRKDTYKPFIMKASKAKFIEDWVIKKLVVEKLKQRLQTIMCDVSVAFIIIYPKSVYFTKKNTRSNRVLDLSNSLQIYEDALTKSGVIVDDRIICSLDGSRRLYHDDPSYLVEIVISEIKKEG